MKNILLIKLRFIGDVVLCTPLLPLIRKQYPQAKITFLVNPGTAEILENNPYVDEVWKLSRQSLREQFKFIQKLRNQKFDVVLDLTDGDRSAFLAWATGAPVRIGYNREHRWRGKLYTQVLPSEYGTMHMVDYHQQALGRLGIHEAVGKPEMFVPSEASQSDKDVLSQVPNGQPIVLIHPRARYDNKAWPLERFAKVADWLSEQGIRIALIGGQEDIFLGQQILNVTTSKPENLMGQTSLSQLGAVMKRSQLLIGNDGGPMHMAAAVGCPVIGLFGPTDPAVWGPRGSKIKVIYKGIDCEKCFYTECLRGEESCMRQISVEEVYQAAQSLLSIPVKSSLKID